MNLVKSELSVLRGNYNTLLEDVAKKEKYIFNLEAEQRKLEQVLAEAMEVRKEAERNRREAEEMRGNLVRDYEGRLESLQTELNTEKHIAYSLKQ
jgi:hypothetical protein